MSIKIPCAALAAFALMAGAAVAQDTQAPAAAPVQAPPAAPDAPSAEGVATLGSPAPGKGQIVFFRPGKFVGAAVSFKVREGETELGKLGNGVYFVVDVTPGQHEYVVHSEAKDILPIEIDEGEVYYVEGSLSVGVMVGRPNLSPSDKARFEAAGKMKVSKLKS